MAPPRRSSGRGEEDEGALHGGEARLRHADHHEEHHAHPPPARPREHDEEQRGDEDGAHEEAPVGDEAATRGDGEGPRREPSPSAATSAPSHSGPAPSTSRENTASMCW